MARSSDFRRLQIFPKQRLETNLATFYTNLNARIQPFGSIVSLEQTSKRRRTNTVEKDVQEIKMVVLNDTAKSLLKEKHVTHLQNLNDGGGVGGDVAVRDHGSFRLS